MEYTDEARAASELADINNFAPSTCLVSVLSKIVKEPMVVLPGACSGSPENLSVLISTGHVGFADIARDDGY